MGLIELTLQNYENEVIKSNLPVVIKFYDQNCDVCKLLAPVLDKVSADYSARAKFANCDRLKNSEIARKYGANYASQIVVAYKDKKLGIFPGALISKGQHLAAKEDYLRGNIDKYLAMIVK